MISVTILTKNSQKYLTEVLEALRNFDEILVYDNGSTDSTLFIAEQFPNVTIHHGTFIGFGPTHNVASNLAVNDWILSVDADEIVTPEMAKEIQLLALKPECVYSFPRKNFFNGKWIRWCGWHPDRQTRLYNRRNTCFTDAHVHEAIITEKMSHIHCQSPLIHYSYASISDFLNKMQVYSDLFASQNKGKKSSSLSKANMHGLFTFFKSYVLKRGFLGGYEGYVISKYNAHTAYYKYLKLYEANQAPRTKKTNLEKF